MKTITSNLKSQKLGKIAIKLLQSLGQGTESTIEYLLWVSDPRRGSFEEYRDRYFSYYQSLDRLKGKGLVRHKKMKGKVSYILTKRGIAYAQKLDSLELKFSHSARWDGLWRVVIFDIPEIHKLVREVLRNRLKQLGFVKIQKSVFVIPWPCEKLIRQIQEVYGVSRFIRLLEVTRFDGDKIMRKHFNV